MFVHLAAIHPSIWPSCIAKTLNIGHITQTFQPVSFIPAMLISTIGLYHCALLSVTMTLAEGHKVYRKPVGFIFSPASQLILITLDMVLKYFKLNILMLLESEFLLNCYFTDCIKNIVVMHSYEHL